MIYPNFRSFYKNAVVDCCDFKLSELLDTVETDIRIENSMRKPEHFRVFFYMSVDMYLWDEDHGL